jgi:beta-glucosidase
MMADSKGVSWVSEVNIASTWNVELAEKQGIFVGNDSLYIGVNGWYGPAMDIHRNPLAGRNFEYYSSDGVQGGKIAAAVVKGAVSKGVHVYIKHLAMNDQETNRYDVCTWATEQAMREIYYKAFEIAIKEGGANGTMSAFNRVGINTAANFMVYNELLRVEWGYIGADVTDMYGTDGTTYYPSASGDTLVRSGIYPLGIYKSSGRSLDGVWNETLNCVTVDTSATDTTQVASYTQWYWVRQTCKNLLYVSANSNIMENGVDKTAFVGSTLSGMASVALDNVSVAADTAKLGSDLVEYTVAGGELPDGVTLGTDGTLSGTPAKQGTYTFQVQLTVDGWITTTESFTMNVAECDKFELSGATTVEVGSTYSATIKSDKVALEDDGGEYSSIKYSISEGTLPTGLTLSEDGKLTGTATEAGTYTFTIKCTASSSSSNQGGPDGGGPGGGGQGGGDGQAPDGQGGGPGGGGQGGGGGEGMPGGGSSADEFERTYTITVTSAAASETPSDTPATGTVDLTEVNNKIAALESSVADLQKNTDSSSSSSGCGSSIDTTGWTMISILGAAAVAYVAVMLAKKKNSDK